MKKLLLPAILLLFMVPVAFADECPSKKAMETLAKERPGSRSRPYTAGEIKERQDIIAAMPVGFKIAYWAEHFLGFPYDTDPLGKYVSTKRIVYDHEMDCMYLVFRSTELGLTNTPADAVSKALDLRFKTKGKLAKDGGVLNYDERFDYAEDMIASGKWGKDITADIAPVSVAPGSRGYEKVEYVPKAELMEEKYYSRLKDGDVIYFIKDPKKRVVGEIVGHLGIIKMEMAANGKSTPFLVHAGGTKTSAAKCGGGSVKKVPLPDYLSNSSFIGAKFTRF